jgi:hypothetical protein
MRIYDFNFTLQVYLIFIKGRTVAQEVSRWLPTAGGPGSHPGRHTGFVVDKAALEQVLSEYFGFPCQSSFQQFLHHHNHPGQVQ